jgi:hypothetical protein
VLTNRDGTVIAVPLPRRAVAAIGDTSSQTRITLMSRKLTAFAVALAVTAGTLAIARPAHAGSNGYIWQPFFCKDNPRDIQCKKR